MLYPLVLLQVVIYHVCGTVASTTCGPTGKQCLIGKSVCVEGVCKCINPPYTKGDGSFVCYTADETYAELKNDPMLITFNHEKVPLSYPCRFKFTHLQLQLWDKWDSSIGKCEVIVHAFNDKIKGKFFTKGFDVAFRLTYANSTELELSVRNYGTARNGVNFVTLKKTSRDYLPDGPWNFDDINYMDGTNGISVKNFEDPASNQLIFEALKCGLQITFVPYDTELLRYQSQTPGLSVAVDCKHKPKFLSNDLTLALPSVDCQPGVLLDDILLPGLSKEESIIAKAFQTITSQNQPNPNQECAAGHEIMRGCSVIARAQAFSSCYWMLREDTFVKCIDDTKNGEIILSLFNDCVSSFCDGNNSCQDVIDFIISNGCDTVPNVAQLTLFLAGLLCPSKTV